MENMEDIRSSLPEIDAPSTSARGLTSTMGSTSARQSSAQPCHDESVDALVHLDRYLHIVRMVGGSLQEVERIFLQELEGAGRSFLERRGILALIQERLAPLQGITGGNVGNAYSASGIGREALEPPKKRYPDPEPFTGLQNEYESFRFGMDNKFRVDAAYFRDDQDRIGYVFNRLNSKVQTVILPWLRNHPSASLDSFWQQMDTHYLDSNRKDRALSKLSTMKQHPKQKLRHFLSEFEQCYSQCGVTMDDRQIIHLLRKGVKEELSDEITAFMFNSVEEMKNRLIFVEDVLASRSRSAQQKGHLSAPWRNGSDEPQRRADPDSMDWEPTKAQVNAGKPRDPQRRRAAWVTPEERDERRRRGLCLQCGASGHFVRKCPFDPPRRRAPPPAKVAKVSPVLEQEEAIKEKDDEAASEQEN